MSRTMRLMTKIGFAFAVVFGLSIGCGGGDKIQDALKGTEAAKAKVCACKDKACADKEMAAYEKWKEAEQKKFTEADMKKVTKEIDQKFDAAEDAMEACAKKHGGGDAPAADPAAPAPTP